MPRTLGARSLTGESSRTQLETEAGGTQKDVWPGGTQLETEAGGTQIDMWPGGTQMDSREGGMQRDDSVRQFGWRQVKLRREGGEGGAEEPSDWAGGGR